MILLRNYIEKVIKNKEVLTWDIDPWTLELVSPTQMKVSKKYPDGVKCGTLEMALPTEIQPLGKACTHCLDNFRLFMVAIPKEVFKQEFESFGNKDE